MQKHKVAVKQTKNVFIINCLSRSLTFSVKEPEQKHKTARFNFEIYISNNVIQAGVVAPAACSGVDLCRALQFGGGRRRSASLVQRTFGQRVRRYCTASSPVLRRLARLSVGSGGGLAVVPAALLLASLRLAASRQHAGALLSTAVSSSVKPTACAMTICAYSVLV